MLVLVKCFGSCQPFDVPVVVCDAQDGRTALMWAAQNGHTSTVGLLLEKGASVDQAEGVRRRCPCCSSARPASVHVLVFCLNPVLSAVLPAWSPLGLVVCFCREFDNQACFRAFLYSFSPCRWYMPRSLAFGFFTRMSLTEACHLYRLQTCLHHPPSCVHPPTVLCLVCLVGVSFPATHCR